MIVQIKREYRDVINIKGITLLSSTEFEKFKKIIPSTFHRWWLRDALKINNEYFPCLVENDGRIFPLPKRNIKYGIRPVLLIESDMEVGTEFNFARYDWTVLNNDMAICNWIIGQELFKKDLTAEDFHEYDTSDIKKYLIDWATVYGI